jgi:hypothetical protein
VENNFVICCQTVGLTSLGFVFYTSMVFLPKLTTDLLMNNHLPEFEELVPTFHWAIS